MLNPTSYQGIVSKNQNEISLHMSIVAKIITATTTTSVDEAGNNQTFRTLSGNNTYLYSYSENWKYLLNLKRRHRNFTSKHKPTRNIYIYVCVPNNKNVHSSLAQDNPKMETTQSVNNKMHRDIVVSVMQWKTTQQ